MRSFRNSILFFSLFINACFGNTDYFQQDVHYTIHITLDDVNHILRGEEEIIYKNNSSTSLDKLYFHLYPNAYRDNTTILAKEIFDSGDDRMISSVENDFGFIDSLQFQINGSAVSWEFLKDTSDVCIIHLKNPLNSGDSISISTPFRVKIPSAKLSRLGRTDQSYFISQWYPKPAVFDNNGWNYFPYLDQGEYYSEFGKYDVFITLPANYIVAATGIMQNANNEINFLLNNDSATKLISEFGPEIPTLPSVKELKTIHFLQDSIHDFAWFADKRWHVLHDTVALPGSKRIIDLWSYFNNTEAKTWKRSLQNMKDAVLYYSGWVGEYPYSSLSMVDVGDAFGNGMEYPMIATVGNYGDPFQTELVIIHEAGHNWFYGVLGSNERCHPWMDEGVNNFYETRYVYTKYKDDSLKQFELTGRYSGKFSLNHRLKQMYGYLTGARRNSDQSPDMCSQNISINNYHDDVYYKTAISFDYLKSYLGDSIFDKCMHNYFSEWKFRHPQPENMQAVFEKTANKKLEWFFGDLLSTNKKLDYSIDCIKHADSLTHIMKITNKGGVEAPISVSTLSENKVIETTWHEGFRGTSTININSGNYDHIAIDAEGRMPELFSSNNTIRTKGLLKKTEPLRLKFGTRFEKREESQLYYLPAFGWNNYNKFMAGIILHNYSFLEKKFEFALMPLYSFGTRNIAGGGHVLLNLHPDSRLNRVSISAGLSRYAFLKDEYLFPGNEAATQLNTLHFTKADFKIILNFLPRFRQKHISTKIILRDIFVSRDIPYFFNYRKQTKKINYLQAEYIMENLNPLEKNRQRVGVTYGDKFLYGFGEAEYFMCYGKKDKGFKIRGFAGGTSIPENGTSGIDYNMNLSGRDGQHDYLFDEVFLGRSERDGILSQQFVNDFAGFKAPTSFFLEASKWMGGINVSTTLPGLLPFRLFASAGTSDNAGISDQFGKISWEIGVDLPVIKDIFVVSFPFAYSDDIRYAIDKQKLNKGSLIRFELHINKLNPIHLLKSIDE